MLEVTVHQQLRAFLRDQGRFAWPHHLTMARLVARALRLSRHTLIQVGSPGESSSYRLSYLISLLLWPEPLILVAPEAIHQRLLHVELPRLRDRIPVIKSIQQGDRWPGEDFRGLLLTTPQVWLRSRLTAADHFPTHIPVVIEQADALEQWLFEQQTQTISPQDWQELELACPCQQELIQDIHTTIVESLFHHPANPYECRLLTEAEAEQLQDLFQQLEQNGAQAQLTRAWQHFKQRLQQPNQLLWATLDRQQRQVTLQLAPLELAKLAAPLWATQTLILVQKTLDRDPEATRFRQQLGLPDLTSVQFAPDRQTAEIQIYLPEKLPLPNTPNFQRALLKEVWRLLALSATASGVVVLLINDVPLRAQISATLAAEFGSRVQVEQTCLDDNGILVSGWQFWQDHQAVLPAPQLLIMATLPLPSLENPLVAGRVAYYKRNRQDWFKHYLLPSALKTVQSAVAPVRETQGTVAIMDARVIYRSYGQEILSSLDPAVRLSYLPADLFVTGLTEEAH
ncbi:MAG: helicase C-terminal domain-containing protein [Cyanobacteria bacterium P01_H01_bin.121]